MCTAAAAAMYLLLLLLLLLLLFSTPLCSAVCLGPEVARWMTLPWWLAWLCNPSNHNEGG